MRPALHVSSTPRSLVSPFYLSMPPSPSSLDIQPDVRERLIHSLSSWHFEPHKLPEEEVIACSYILFEALYRIENMFEVICVPLSKYPFWFLGCAGARFLSRKSCDLDWAVLRF